MNDKFILKGKEVAPCNDLMEWARWFETANRHVAQDEVGDVRISTVFIGINHNFWNKGPPLVFETMIFGGPHDQHQTRAATWDEAEAQHAEAMAMVRSGLNSEKNS